MAIKKLLITGSNGCVGQYLIDWFLKNTRFRLYLMVRDQNKLPLSIQKNKRIKLLICDIRECHKFSKEISQINFLIHTATAWGDPKRAYEVHIKAFEELFRFVLAKSICMYLISKWFPNSSFSNQITLKTWEKSPCNASTCSGFRE